MTWRQNSFLEAIDRSSDPEGLQDAIKRLRDALGIAHMTYAEVSWAHAPRHLGTYPASWLQHVDEHGLWRQDPVQDRCRIDPGPVDWSDIDWSPVGARTLRARASAAGIGPQGLSLPLWGPCATLAIFTANDSADHDRWSAFLARHGRDFAVAAHAIHTRVRQLRDPALTPAVRSLSTREAEVLTLLAQGRSRAQIARHLSISEHTLRSYIETARLKLGGSNTLHAVARAVALGLVRTEPEETGGTDGWAAGPDREAAE